MLEAYDNRERVRQDKQFVVAVKCYKDVEGEEEVKN